MAISVGYRHGDYPVKVHNSFVIRAQDFNLDQDLVMRTVYELGNATPAGIDDAPDIYTGGITWFPINMDLERSCIEATTGSVSLKQYADATGVSVASLTKGITGAKVVSIEYSCESEGEYRGTIRFEATGWDADGETSITTTDPTGAGAFRAPVANIELDSTSGVRVQSFRLRAGTRVVRMYQLGSAVPVGIQQERPEVTLEVTWFESSSMAGETAMTLASPKDVEIQVGSATWDAVGNIQHICNSMISSGDGTRGSIDGWATYTQRYISRGCTTTYGLVTDIIAA